MKIDRGSVVLVVLDPTVAHEQRGYRPCVAVSDPAVNLDPRFPLLAVVPITGTAGEGALYPPLAAGKCGLAKSSYALVDQVRSVDKRRIRRVFGRISADELRAIDQGLARFASDPAAELRELLLRDVLDVALGNTDNHGRNTSVLKDAAGRVALSPLYDFAPMVLDRSGIARVSRWTDGADYPDWRAVTEALGPLGLAPPEARRWLRSLAARVRKLPATLRACDVPAPVIEACEARIRRVADSLAKLPEDDR